MNEYELLKPVGAGSFGTVYLAERRVPGEQARPFAVKVMKKSLLRAQRQLKRVGGAVTAWDRVMREVQLWRHLFHRHCVLLFEVRCASFWRPCRCAVVLLWPCVCPFASLFSRSAGCCRRRRRCTLTVCWVAVCTPTVCGVPGD